PGLPGGEFFVGLTLPAGRRRVGGQDRGGHIHRLVGARIVLKTKGYRGHGTPRANTWGLGSDWCNLKPASDSYGFVTTQAQSKSLAEANSDPWPGADGQRPCAQQN